jgi:tRNA wybutosine-synthesizing protein 1
VGYSRRRLPRDASPSHKEIREFAEELAEKTGYRIVSEAPESGVVLLSRLDEPIRLSPMR